MDGQIAVSVVIPARNAADTLRRALDSVMAQTLRPLETIVVDDGSTDGTAALASSFPDVRVITLARPSGAAMARNEGIRAARGEWIAFLDADDEWLPGKLELQAGKCGPGPALVFCASEEFAPDGRSLGDTFRGRLVETGAEAWKALLKTNFVSTPTAMAPRALLLRVGGFDESLAVGEDQDLWIRLALEGPLTYIPEQLVHVHVRPKSLSAFRPTDQSQYVIPMIERHLSALKGRLSRSDVRAILGERLNNAGRIAFAHGDYLRGAAFLLRAVLIGYRPLSGLAVMVKAPAAALVRRALRGAPRRQMVS